mmetsp:Transcript_32793/g.94185  ORF Transcript_32793/g.94185 Transcript_32793/m.94185 type:complete len:258 (-) Transcript_32793:80-853(-)
MVQPHHVVPHALKQVRNGVPQDGRAQVAYMHLLGDVWGGIIYDNPLGRLGPEVDRSPVQALDLPLDPGRPQLHGDEALGRYVDGLHDLRGGGRQAVLDRQTNLPRVLPLRGCARVALLSLEDAHGIVALVVPEARVCDGNLRADRLVAARERGQRGLEEALELALQARLLGHGGGRLRRQRAHAAPRQQRLSGAERSRRTGTSTKSLCQVCRWCPIRKPRGQGQAHHHGAYSGGALSPLREARPASPARKGWHGAAT